MLINITSSLYRLWLKSILIIFSIVFVHSANAQQPLNGFPYTDSFRFPTSPGTTFGGTNGNSTTVYSAFLTASQTAVNSFGSVGGPPDGGNQLVTADQSGGGYLRLTRTVTNQTGFARNTRSFPSNQGLSISFEYYTYGGTADGIVFSLFDAAVVDRLAASNTAVGYTTGTDGFQIGQFGGSIGYAQRNDVAGGGGMSRGFLGIAFDEFGNFGVSGGAQGRQGGYAVSPARTANWIVLRGDGDGTGGSQPGFGAGTNYEYLVGVNTADGTRVNADASTSTVAMGGTFNIAAPAAPASRTAGFAPTDNGYRKARIIVEYVNPSLFTINVYVDANTGAGMVTRHVIQDYSYVPTEAAPANLSYAFSSSTGGSVNVHEIRAIDIAAPLSTLQVPVAASATTSTLEDNAVTLDLTTFAYDQNGNDQLNWATGLDLDPTIVGVQASRTIPGQGTFTSNASGTITFTPVANYNGTVTTDYTIADLGNAVPFVAVSTSNPASLTITVIPVNDPPVAASRTVTTNEDVPYTFTAVDFALTDPFDTPENLLDAVQITTLPATGTLLLAGAPVVEGATITIAQINAASFTYLPPSNQSASPMTSFTFRVRDDGGITNGGIDVSIDAATMTINVLPVNDPPAGIDKSITTNEDVPYTFQITDFDFTDAFDTPPNGLLSVIVSPPGAGSLTIGGVPIAVSTTIAAASITSLVYTPPLNSSASPTTTFTFQVRDNGGTDNGGVDLDPIPNTITINVLGVNDPPSGTDKLIASNEDTPYTLTLADFGFTDPFDTPANNFLSVLVSPVGAGSLTIGGVPVAVSTTISAASVTAGSLIYTPPLNAIGNPFTTFTFQVRDDGGTLNGGVDTDPSPNTISFNITNVNDPPSGTDKLIASNEDTPYTLTLADFGFTDPFDTPANNFLSVLVSPVGAGSLTIGGVPVAVSTTISAASVTAGSLIYTPPLNAIGNPFTTFTFQVRDDGGTLNGGVDTDPSPNTISFNITNVNDPPAGTDKLIASNEDTPYTLTLADFGFTDPFDTPANNFLSVLVSPVGAGSLTIGGVPVAVSTTISAASVTAGSLIYTPPLNAIGNPFTTFTFQVRDDGGTLNGGVDTDPSPNTISFNITNVNDPPAGTDKLIASNEDTPYTLTLADFGFTDPFDTPANNFLSVLVSPVGAGSLTIGGVPVAVSTTISAASVTAGSLIYTPPLNAIGNPFTTFTFQVRDDGGTLNGGVDTDPSPNTISFNITNVNDPPSGTDKLIASNEDTPYTLTLADFGFTDPFDTPANNFLSVLVSPVGAGSLTIGGVPVAVSTTISAASVTAGSLIYTPPLNAIGNPFTTFTFQVRDDGGTLNGGVDTDPSPNTISFNITNVNDPPSGTDKLIASNEDTPYTLTLADFGFTDPFDTPANNFLSVLVSPVGAGSLTIGGVPVAVSTTISAASVTAGSLIYTPPLNANGNPFTTFTFQVRDDGGTLNGGVDTDPSPNTISFNILPVNDAPVANPDVNTVIEDVTLTVAAGAGLLSNDTDVEGTPLTITQYFIAGDAVAKTVDTPVVIAGVGTINIAANGGYSFIPAANYTGPIPVITYTVSDGALTATSTLTLTIIAVNDPPSFVKGPDQAILTNAGAQTVTGWATNLSKGPADEAAQTLTFTVTNNNNALFTVQPAISPTGVLTYTPAGTAGTSTVTVVLKDNGGTANGGVDTFTTQTFTITVTSPTPPPGPNTPPVVDVIPKVGIRDTPVAFTVADFTSKYTDANNNPMTKIRIVTLPPSGTLRLDGVNIVAGQEIPVADLAKITFIPATGFTGGPVTFQWNGSDGTDYAVTPKDVNITITATNDAPVAVADAYSTVRGGTLTVAAPGVLNNDSDPNGNPITAIKVTDPANGTVTLNPNGSFTYVHNNGTSTSDSFTYKVNDGIVDGNTVTVTITINASNTPPVIVDIPKTGVIDQPVTFTANDFTSKFTDPNGDALNKIRIVTLPPSGTLRLNGIPITIGQEIPLADLPNITFLPPAGFSGGPISFQWNGSDGTDYASTPRNVNITIAPTSISIAVTEVCIGDVPWVQYTITGQGFAPAANSARIQWRRMDGTVVRELTNQALTGQLLWPGAVVDANGIPTAWPGWNFTNGQWVQVSDGLRPQMRLHISINPDTEVTVNYPPATPFCSANPNRPPVVSNITKTGTGFSPIPFTVNDFTSRFTDPDLDPLVRVRIQTLPPDGVLRLNGVPVTINQEIPVADLARLTFEPAPNWSGTTNFTWNGSDGDNYARSPANAAITVIAPSDPNAKIGLAKNLASVTPALNGTYDVKFVFTAVNFGPNGLENISIKDNLALAFGGTEVLVRTITAFGNLRANTAFNGSTVTELLLPTSRLVAGEEAKVELLINVRLLLTSGVFQNTATAEAISSLTGFKVNDISTNGLRPDPNVPGDVSPSVTTPIKLDAFPTYVPSGFSPNGDGMNDKFVVQNANGKHVSLEMYNRWGNRVYKSDDYKNDWGGEVTEGFFLGREIPDGTYYYIIIIDKKDRYAGFITVNR
jgi:gliding motility-associated-like protein